MHECEDDVRFRYVRAGQSLAIERLRRKHRGLCQELAIRLSLENAREVSIFEQFLGLSEVRSMSKTNPRPIEYHLDAFGPAPCRDSARSGTLFLRSVGQ